MSKYLYHYTSEDTISKYIINNDFLRFSHLKNTNDPKEILPPEITIENINVCNDEKLFYKVFDLISGEIHKYKLLCFTIDDSKPNGFDRPSMWAHYANKHNGCCLKINKQKFEEELAILKKIIKLRIGLVIKYLMCVNLLLYFFTMIKKTLTYR